MGKATSFEKRKNRAGYVFLSPWLFATVFLLIYPVVFSFLMSFGNIKSLTSYNMTFAGFENYKEAFVVDDSFLPMLLSTVSTMLIDTPMILIFSLITAVILNRSFKLRSFFRLVFFLPVLLGTGYIMSQLLGQNVQSGSMEIARGMLLPANVQQYLGSTLTRYITDFFNRITLIMWNSGVQIVLFLSGLQGISPSLYEASRIDGASEWEIFWKITLPMTTPILLLNAVYTVISFAFEDNDLLNYIVSQGFEKNKFEYSSAMSWIYFSVVLILLGVIFAVISPFIKKMNNNIAIIHENPV